MGERSVRWASIEAISVCPFFNFTEKQSTSPVLASFQFTTAGNSTNGALRVSSFGSVSGISRIELTKNGRSPVAPELSYSRIQYTSGERSAEAVTVNVPFSLLATNFNSRLLVHACTGHLSNVPLAVTSIVVPLCMPPGNKDDCVGGAANAGTLVANSATRKVGGRPRDWKIVSLIPSILESARHC